MPKHAERYKELLSTTRRRASTVMGRNLALEAASDRGRVMFSTAFRRLQSKTQVFPQESNAAVRTRLTHSLEVSSIGRYIAESLVQRLVASGELGPAGESETTDRATAFVALVEISCLMHDLGNPPFGHFGERAIQGWFANRRGNFATKVGAGSSPTASFKAAYDDLEHFDGNPQGFRIAVKLQWNVDEFGYNLTCTQLASLLKYPWTPERIGQPQGNTTIKKAGVFHSEAAALGDVQTALNLAPSTRHPLTYVMEAADDISYCLSDIEDALEKHVVHGDDMVSEVRASLATAPSNSLIDEILSVLPTVPTQNNDWFLRFRTEVTNKLVKRAVDIYLERHDDIMRGDYFSLLAGCPGANALLEAVRQFSEKHLYASTVVRERELVGYQVISGTLNRYKQLLDLPSKAAHALICGRKKLPNQVLEPTLASFLPRKHVKVYENACMPLKMDNEFDEQEWIARAHMVVDFLSGMTDDFAILFHKRLVGGGSF